MTMTGESEAEAPKSEAPEEKPAVVAPPETSTDEAPLFNPAQESYLNRMFGVDNSVLTDTIRRIFRESITIGGNTKGDLFYWNGEMKNLGIGSANQLLKVASGLPSWATVNQAVLSKFASGSNTNITSAADITNTEVTIITTVETRMVVFGFGRVTADSTSGRDVKLWVRKNLDNAGYSDLSGGDGYYHLNDHTSGGQVQCMGLTAATAAGTHKFKLRGQETNGSRITTLNNPRIFAAALPTGS